MHVPAVKYTEHASQVKKHATSSCTAQDSALTTVRGCGGGGGGGGTPTNRGALLGARGGGSTSTSNDALTVTEARMHTAQAGENNNSMSLKNMMSAITVQK